jgi:[ribosomal protein S5]-alanine N-acetyltransferase
MDTLGKVPLVKLRPPTEDDQPEFTERVLASRALHYPWLEPTDPVLWLEGLLSRNRTDTDRCRLVCDAGQGFIAGAMNLSQISSTPFLNAYLGYYAFEPFAGKGYMTAAMRLLLRYAFGELGLHRVQANVQPGNGASIALVRSAGFHYEGYSPRYLFINGDWRDHEQWVMLAEDAQPLQPSVNGGQRP